MTSHITSQIGRQPCTNFHNLVHFTSDFKSVYHVSLQVRKKIILKSEKINSNWQICVWKKVSETLKSWKFTTNKQINENRQIN